MAAEVSAKPASSQSENQPRMVGPVEVVRDDRRKTGPDKREIGGKFPWTEAGFATGRSAPNSCEKSVFTH
jgi:hypothetical protein